MASQGGDAGQSDSSDGRRDSTQAAIARQAAAAIQGDSTAGSSETRDDSDVALENTQDVNLTSTSEGLPPPPYGSQQYGTVREDQNGFGMEARVGDDGRVNINIKQSNRRLSQVFLPALERQQTAIEHESVPPLPYIPPSLGGDETTPPPPSMNIVIQVVGSRGDVQPFVALGKVLKETYGHRVRLATHPNFEGFVRENGLEFFSIGADPAQLMAFMVKHPGLMPGFDAIRTGDIGKRRKDVEEYIKGCWRSCFETGDGKGIEVTNDSIPGSQSSTGSTETSQPFVADCIIANPPSFAHVHCADKLGIPLHIMFTMPYSPTQAFPHPLANIQSSNADPRFSNYITYALVDMLTWQGLGDIINRFRERSLGLDPISLIRAPGMLQRMKIPHTYCWSPALIPKPEDWSHHISIAGFYFLNLASNFTPDPDLKAFLDAGPPPVYIGFGSIVLDDPNAMTEMIFEAVRKTGQRCLLSKGWGGMGADEMGKPDGVYMLGNCPHDWLFQRVSCVVHHGGAGTTAAGISAGRPTLVIPFFGDQPFWGSMVARAGAGPEPIPHKQLTAEKLAEGIQICLKTESQERAQELASKIAAEKGSDAGAQSFHQFLDPDKLRCNLAPARVAVWRLKRTQIRLSTMAACTLAQANLLNFTDLKLFRGREYETDEGPWDPISGASTALVGTLSAMMLGVADFPVETLKALRIHPDSVKKKINPAENDENVDHGNLDTQLSQNRSTTTLDSTADRGRTTTTGSNPSTPGTSASTFNFQDSFSRIASPSGTSEHDAGPSSQAKAPLKSSMADALRAQFEQSVTSSRSRSNSPGHQKRSGSKDLDSYLETALGTGKGVGNILSAGFSSPMDFTMGLSKGFRNAPKLYGDDTVRKHEQVTDFKSGLRVASKEFGLGMYDGISGLVTQPLRGAQKDGAAGFIKGIGKGIGGIALKPSAAVFSVPAYTMKGVQKEMQKRFGSSVQNYIIASRIAQGYEEWQRSSPEEQADVVRRWQIIKRTIKKKRNPDEVVREILEEQRLKHSERLANLKKRADECRTRSRTGSRTGRGSPSSRAPAEGSAANIDPLATNSDSHENRTPGTDYEDDDADLNEAIRRSVQETSRGDKNEDADIERAIQASIADLQRQRDQETAQTRENDEMKQAMAASRSESHADVLYDEEFERVLAQSLAEQRRRHGNDLSNVEGSNDG